MTAVYFSEHVSWKNNICAKLKCLYSFSSVSSEVMAAFTG